MAVLALLILSSLLAGSNAYAVPCIPPTPLYNHSSQTADLPIGATFTAFCSFSLSSAGGKPKVQWEYMHEPAVNASISIHYDNRTLQTILTIPNVTVSDGGFYTVSVSDHCGEATVGFNLKVDPPCADKIPKPVGKLYNTLVVPESEHIQLTANFTGYLTSNDITWSKAGVEEDVCDKYHCSCTVESICAFFCQLTILQPRVRDSGNYSARPSNTDIADHSVVVFSVSVLPNPTLTRWPGRKLFINSSAPVELVYQLANFTEFVELVFVLNDSETVNTANDSRYRLKITHNPLNSENVTISLQVPQQSPGVYKLCYQFSSVVTRGPSEVPVPCSPPSTVVRVAGDNVLLEIEVTVPVCAVVLAVMCGMSVGGIYCWWVRKGKHRVSSECERPLLQPNQEVSSDSSDTEEDSTGGGRAVPGTRALQDLLRRCCGEDLSKQELQDIANDLATSATNIGELGVRLLGSTQLMEEVRGQRNDSSYILCLRVLEAWLDDTPTETARSRLVETVFHYRPELATAIAENRLTT